MNETPLLSIIITSYDMDRLRDTLELLDSIQAQTYSNIETIFVAERSVDLYNRVKGYVQEKALHNFKVVFNERELGMSAARNLGIRNTAGAIIAFIDDDALPFPDWAEETVKIYEDDSVIAATGPALPLWENVSMKWIPDEFYWLIGCTAWSDWQEQREVRNTWGMNMSFKREAFEIAGDFSTEIGAIQGKRLHGEEDELSLRIKQKTGKRIIFSPKVRVKHRVYKHRLTAKYIARSSYWIGYTRQVMSRLYSNDHEGQNVLNVEHQLLRRIINRFFPRTLAGLFRHPRTAWRQLFLAANALFFVAAGYISGKFEILADNK